MGSTRSASKAPAALKKAAKRLEPREAAASANRAKHVRAAEMIKELRSGAEALLENADRLLNRLS